MLTSTLGHLTIAVLRALTDAYLRETTSCNGSAVLTAPVLPQLVAATGAIEGLVEGQLCQGVCWFERQS